MADPVNLQLEKLTRMVHENSAVIQKVYPSFIRCIENLGEIVVYQSGELEKFRFGQHPHSFIDRQRQAGNAVEVGKRMLEASLSQFKKELGNAC